MGLLMEARPSGEDRGEEQAVNVVRVVNNRREQPIFCRSNKSIEGRTFN